MRGLARTQSLCNHRAARTIEHQFRTINSPPSTRQPHERPPHVLSLASAGEFSPARWWEGLGIAGALLVLALAGDVDLRATLEGKGGGVGEADRAVEIDRHLFIHAPAVGVPVVNAGG